MSPRALTLSLALLLPGVPGSVAAQGFVIQGGGPGGQGTGIDFGQGHTVLAPRTTPGSALPSPGRGLSRPATIRRTGRSAEWNRENQARQREFLSRSRSSRQAILKASGMNRRLLGSAARDRLAAMRANRQGNLITPEGIVKKDPPGTGHRLRRTGGGIVSLAPAEEDAPETRGERPERRKTIATIGGR